MNVCQNVRSIVRTAIFLAIGLSSNIVWGERTALAQLLSSPPIADKAGVLEHPSSTSIAKERALIEEIYEPELVLRVDAAQSKIIKTKFPMSRTLISNPAVVDIQAFNATEFEIIGKRTPS